MPALSDYANVDNTALIMLNEMGYQTWYDQKMEMYGCEKDGWDFYAESATALLGCIKIYEYHNPKHYSEYWWRIEEPWIVQSQPEKPSPYVSVTFRKSDS